MTSIASFSNKTDFLSSEIPITTSGNIRVLLNLPGFGVGLVQILFKNAQSVFQPYPELTFTTSAAFQLPVISGDVIKVQFTGCNGAGIEVDQ